MPGLRGVFSRPALICLAVIVAVDLLVTFTRTSWIGFLDYTWEWANAGLYVVAPLMAGASAFLQRRHFTPGIVHITGARRPAGAFKVAVTAWMRMVILFVFGHAVVLAISLGVSLQFGSSGVVFWQPLVYALLPIAIACAVGVSITAVLPTAWAGPLAVVATYLHWYLLVALDAAVPVNIGGATINIAGLQYRTDVLVVSVVTAAIVTSLFLIVCAYATRAQKFSRGLIAVGVAMSAVVVVGTLFGAWVSDSRFEAGGDVAYECDGAAPRVCLSAAHASRLGEIAEAVDGAAAHLRDVGVDLQGVVLREELVESAPGPEGVLMLPLDRLNGIGGTRTDYATSLTRPANCEAYYTPVITPGLDRLLTAAMLMDDWMVSVVDGSTAILKNGQVADVYKALRECAVGPHLLEALDLP
jgi:hypothetical protein